MIQQVYVSVTPEDILKGERGDSCKCPIALALKRLFPSGGAVEVCEHFMYFDDGVVRWFTSLIPLEALRFIEQFDANERVSPFNFMVTFFQKESLRPSILGNFDPI